MMLVSSFHLNLSTNLGAYKKTVRFSLCSRFKMLSLLHTREQVYTTYYGLSRKKMNKIGNGKIDHTPYPVSLKKIKRIGLNVFLSLRELVNVNRVKVVKPIPPKRNRKKSVFRCKRPSPVVIKPCMDEYEPSPGIRLLNSSPRRWNRVNEWQDYINDSGRANKRDT